MALNTQQKLTLFKLLSRAASHDLEEKQLFLTLLQQGPEDLKKITAEAEVLIRKSNSFAIAGQKTGLFNDFETKVLKKATETGNIAPALSALASYYDVRINVQSPQKLLTPYALMLLVAAIIAPIPGLIYGSSGAFVYLLQTTLPAILLIAIMWLLGLPTHLLQTKWAQDMKLPQLTLQIPSLGSLHTRHEVGTFLECCGILRKAGYEWINAVYEASLELCNPVIQSSLKLVITRMKSRDTFTEAIAACEYLDNAAVKRIQAADENGNDEQVPAALMEINKRYLIKSGKTLDSEVKTPARIMILTTILLATYTVFSLAQFKGLL